mgnify:CR=1 FL=1
MKALISLIAVMAASVAMAQSASSIQAMSWAEILNDSSLTTYNDLIFDNGPGLGTTWKRSTDASVCHDGSMIYGGKTRVEVCSGDDNDDNCKSVTVKLKTPFRVQYKTQVCSGNDSDEKCKWVVKTRVQTPNRRLAVYSKGQDEGKGDSFLAKKAYVIPFCDGLAPVPAN